MAARSLITLFRNTRPELLHKKDRGRPSEATAEIVSKKYGEVIAKDFISGAEVLLEEHSEEVEINSNSGSDEDEWIDIKHSSDEEAASTDDEGEDEENEDDGEDEDDSNEDEESSNENDDSKISTESDTKSERKILKAKRTLQTNKSDLAKQVVLDRILTDEDFKRIEIANAKKHVVPVKKGTKRQLEETVKERPSELVKLGDIENIYKKRKHDKQSRLETVRRGQADREKFGYKDGRLNIHCSKTNREKRKNKNFLMLRHKAKGKVKKSFKDKQIALRNHLLKQKRMK